MKNNKLIKKRIIAIVVIVGVVIVPLLYSFFYLDAFWDPYATLSDLPVAIVNNDKGALINDEQRNLGNEMCDELKNDKSLKFIFTDEVDAQSGTEGTKYYAIITIPENFSSDIASANSQEKKVSTIIFKSNEKRNFLATQILGKAVDTLEIKTKEKISKEITKQLSDKLKSAPDQLNELSDGIQKLYDGSSTFNDKLGDFNKGVNSAKNGSDKLNSGLTDLNSGLDTLLNGATQLNDSVQNINQLKDGSNKLAASAKEFNNGLIGYTQGVEKLIGSVNNTSAFLQKYVTEINPAIMKDPYFSQFIMQMKNPENEENLKILQQATSSLKQGSDLLSKGISDLSSATTDLPKLKEGIKSIKDGLVSAKSGANLLKQGSQTLNSGLKTLNDATGKLSDGSKELKDGLNTAKTELGDSINSTNDQLKVLDGIEDFAGNPVEFENQSINHVPNYGTAFAPYFLSLSFWVGALIIFFGIYLDADSKFDILSRNSNNKIARSFIYLLIGFVQAIVLGVVLTACLGLNVEHIWLYYFACCLISMVFIAIVQFFLVFLKDIGKFLAIAFLILQLTSCGGTFPMETVPKFFNVLYPFMPMTYSVGLLKEAISSPKAEYAAYNIIVLVCILIVFMVLTVVCSLNRKKKQEKIDQNINND